MTYLLLLLLLAILPLGSAALLALPQLFRMAAACKGNRRTWALAGVGALVGVLSLPLAFALPVVIALSGAPTFPLPAPPSAAWWSLFAGLGVALLLFLTLRLAPIRFRAPTWAFVPPRGMVALGTALFLAGLTAASVALSPLIAYVCVRLFGVSAAKKTLLGCVVAFGVILGGVMLGARRLIPIPIAVALGLPAAFLAAFVAYAALFFTLSQDTLDLVLLLLGGTLFAFLGLGSLLIVLLRWHQLKAQNVTQPYLTHKKHRSRNL